MTKPAWAPPSKWDRRIERARELVGRYPFATEVLTFYSKLAALQQASYSRLQSTLRAADVRNGELSPELNSDELEALMPQFRPFLSFLQREGPSALAGFALGLEKRGPRDWAQLLKRLWCRDERDLEWVGGVDEEPAEPVRLETEAGPSDRGLARFTALAFLQPYAECLADRAAMPAPVVRRPVCTFCGSKPLAGILRPEGDGAKRSLICSFCYTEWDYLRIACPACEESRDERMCVYVASQFEHIRVEACETCRTYIKTVDLTKNGLAIPEVDELASIPLTLWADDQGYTKLSRNIFGC